MSNPALQLSTLFVLDGVGRIVSVRERNGSKGPLFALVRGQSSNAFASRADVPTEVAAQLHELASTEPYRDDGAPPVHAARYLSLCELVAGVRLPLASSLAIAFDASVARLLDFKGAARAIDDLKVLRRNFPHWTVDDLIERGPVVGVLERGDAVSVCYCARRAMSAAEAGAETLPAFQGRGFGTQAVAEWVHSVRDSGRVALYSVLAHNHASLRIAEKLNFQRYATDWSVLESPLE